MTLTLIHNLTNEPGECVTREERRVEERRGEDKRREERRIEERSEEKKERLIKLAEKYDFYIIEDDPFSEFYYDGERPSVLKSMDKTGYERVIYIRTYSTLGSQKPVMSYKALLRMWSSP